MPQLFLPGEAVPIGLEAALYVALTQTFGFNSQPMNWGVIGGTGVIVAALSLLGNNPNGKYVDNRNAIDKGKVKEDDFKYYYKDNDGKQKTMAGAKLNAPALVAAETVVAFGVASYYMEQNIVLGDVLVIAGLAYAWNMYIYKYFDAIPASLYGSYGDLEKNIQSYM